MNLTQLQINKIDKKCRLQIFEFSSRIFIPETKHELYYFLKPKAN